MALYTPKHISSRESPPEERSRSSNVTCKEDVSANRRLDGRGARSLVGALSILRTQLSKSARGVAFDFAVLGQRGVD